MSNQHFFITGGTLGPEAPSYVERAADRELFDALASGEFCYVLTSRQMGKSSLMVRTASQLRDDGHAVAAVDLTAIGRNLSIEQWYLGILDVVGQNLGLESEIDASWQRHSALGPLRRWRETLRDVVVEHCPRPVAVFVDEIDYVLSLPFSTDEFFAAIRELYTARGLDPELNRLTFCLLGVASPSDLICDVRTTPFNIGRRIELADFSLDDALGFAQGLNLHGDAAKTVLKRVLDFTGGHPYLSQRLCETLTRSDGPITPRQVDRLAREIFLTHRASDRDTNLLFVRDRLLRGGDVSARLDLYRRILGGAVVPDDETNPVAGELRLAGVVRPASGRLEPRNRIYSTVFDRRWVERNTSGAELLRQRAAFRRGLLRAAAVATVVVAVTASLAVFAFSQRNAAQIAFVEAAARRAESQRLLYVALMQLAAQAWDRKEASRVANLLEQAAQSGSDADLRGFEWHFLSANLPYRLEASRRAHSTETRAVAFSTDGRLATAGDSIALWTLPDLEDAGSPGDVPSPRAMTAADDGSWMAIAGERIHVLNASHRTEFGGEGSPVRALASSPDGRLLAAGRDDGTVELWDPRTGALASRVSGHSGRADTMAFTPDGARLVTGSRDRTIRVWNVPALKLERVLNGHEHWVMSVACLADGRTLVSGSIDKTVRLWDLDTGRQRAVYRGHSSEVYAVAGSPDGSRVASGGYDSQVHVWDARTLETVAVLSDQSAYVASIAYSDDGTRIAAGCGDGTAYVWRATPAVGPAWLGEHPDRVAWLALSPDERRVATAGADGIVRVWGVDGGEPLVFRGHSKYVTSVAFAPAGDRVASAALDGTVRVWNAADATEILTLQGPGGELTDVTFSPDGRWLAAAGDDGLAVIWNGENGTEMARLAHSARVQTAAFSPDGRVLATGGYDNRIHVWDTANWTEIATLGDHTAEIRRLVFSADGQTLAAGSGDKRISLWNTRDWTSKAVLAGSRAPVNDLAFSPDGTRLAAATWERTIDFWDLMTHKQVFPLSGHEQAVLSVKFSRDGQTLYSAGDDGTLRIWSARPAS